MASSTDNHIEMRPPLAEVERRIAARAAKLLDRTEPNAWIASYLDSWVQQNFRGEGVKVGGWTPFKRGGRWIPGVGLDTTAKLLQDTGALRASFRAFFDSKIVGIGSDLEYSATHELGTDKVPRRRILPTGDEVLPDLVKLYDRYFETTTREALW